MKVHALHDGLEIVIAYAEVSITVKNITKHHLCAVASNFADDSIYVSGLLSVQTRNKLP